MPNSEEPQTVFQEILGFKGDRSAIANGRAATTTCRAGLWSHFLSTEWSSAALYLFLDVVSWLAIYRVAGWLRYDAFYATPFQFFVINLIQLAVIVAALYFVGGYDRTVEKLTLGYAAEHLLTLTAAGLVSAMLIYSAATFDQTMKPSRGVLLLSFAIFLPLSLAYRRWIRQYVVASSVGRSFLVIGGGTIAVRFYEAYRKSPNAQQLEFVDVNEERVGQPIAGEGSPIVQGNLAAKLSNLGSHYSGIDIPDHKPGDGYEAPKVWWNPSISPGGLMIYTGDLFPAWKGDAIVPALSGEALIRVDIDGDKARKANQWPMGERIRAVDQGPGGSVYLLEDGGRLLRLDPVR